MLVLPAYALGAEGRRVTYGLPRWDRPREDGYVYCARPELGDRPVKIGWSTNPWSAAREARRWTWFEIEIVATVKVSNRSRLWGTEWCALERTLHDALESDRLVREWFEPSPKVLELIDLAHGGASAADVFRWAMENMTPEQRSFSERFGRRAA